MSKININLHSILQHLAEDENFLSTIIEEDDRAEKQKKSKQKSYNLMANMVTEYIALYPNETQPYSIFPQEVKEFLTPNYVRCGIKNVMERNMTMVNISFLNSLNMLLRPEIYNLTLEEHTRNLALLENFVCHKIQRNFQIDKVKNTKKVQTINKELIKNLLDGHVSHQLIQCIVNIFEINLLVFDFVKMEIYFYWTKGIKYPFLNPFKNIFCMSYIQGNYEPIMPPNNIISEEQKRKIYLNILSNLPKIKCQVPVELGIHTLVYIDSWSISFETYSEIMGMFNKKSKKKASDYYKSLESFDSA